MGREACGFGVPLGDPRRRVAGVLQLAASRRNRARQAVPQAPAPTGEAARAAISSFNRFQGRRPRAKLPNSYPTLAQPRLLAGPPVGLPGSARAVAAMPGTRPGLQLRRARDAGLVQPVAHVVGHRAVLVGELQLVRCGGQSGSGRSVRPISVAARSR